MEIEWEFEVLRPREIADIRNELKNIITNFFKESINPDCESVISRYALIHETTTYIFESYRKNFERDIRSRFPYTATETYIELSRKKLILSITIDVLIALKRLELGSAS